MVLEIELDHDAIRAFLQSSDVQRGLERVADAALRRLGPGYDRETFVGPNRANVEIHATHRQTAAKGREEIRRALNGD